MCIQYVWHTELKLCTLLYSVDLEVWSKLAKLARIKRIAPNARAILTATGSMKARFPIALRWHVRVLLSQIISHSDTNGLVLVVMEYKGVCKCVLCIGVFTSYFQGQQSIDESCLYLFCLQIVHQCYIVPFFWDTRYMLVMKQTGARILNTKL